MEIFDISRSIQPSTATWPGDASFSAEWTMKRAEGASVNLSAIRLSSHTATHADAPFHVDDSGNTIDQLPLSAFIGPSTVVAIPDGTAFIRPAHLQPHEDHLSGRVLFKTQASKVPDSEWPEAFPAFAPETIEWLAERSVHLIGTDAPSVDPVDSTDLPAHHALRRHQIVNLEGLQFRSVDPGAYRLVALPLKILDLDASPVRAVLVRA
jgi:arylformamidase